MAYTAVQVPKDYKKVSEKVTHVEAYSSPAPVQLMEKDDTSRGAARTQKTQVCSEQSYESACLCWL